MADFKQCVMAFGLVATTALSGCASTSATEQYTGTGSLFNPQANVTQTVQRDAKQQQQQPGMILQRSFNGLSAQYCEKPDTWVGSSYCFDQKDIKRLIGNDKIAGLQMQQTGPQYGKMIWNSTMAQVYRGTDIKAQSSNGAINLGHNRKGAVNVVQALMANTYESRCLDAFMLTPNSRINGILPKTPKELGTFDNCARELKIAETTHRMGGINIRIK